MEIMKQAIFQLGEEKYGLNIKDVNTVEKVISFEKVSKSPKNVKGIIRLRGDIIPVYSLRMKFGLDDKEPDADTRLIITYSNDMVIAYEVDKMLGISNIEPEAINEVPPVLKSESTSYMSNVINLDGKLIVLLDHDGILSSEEQSGIKNIIKK